MLNVSRMERILYIFIRKAGGWVKQGDIITFKGTDDSRTRKLLIRMKQKGFLRSKTGYIKTRFLGNHNITLWRTKNNKYTRQFLN